MDNTAPLAILKARFGYDSFRALQKEIIGNVLGRRDSLTLMPTGGGKSLCYQLPALIFDGITLVISPLIALMKDQVDALNANGIAARCINSSLAASEIEDVQAQVRRGLVKILYVAPERLVLPAFRRFLPRPEPEPHRDRRGPLHLRVGPRVSARLPQPAAAEAGLPGGAGDCPDRHRDGTGAGGHHRPA